MAKWEYIKKLWSWQTNEEWMKELDTYGDNGWELVTVHTIQDGSVSVAYFKRQRS